MERRIAAFNTPHDFARATGLPYGVDVSEAPPHAPTATERWPDAPLLRACRREPARGDGGPRDRVPVWFMRQAGRSLPEYRAKRGDGSILDAIRIPDLAAEFTLQPVRRYGVDAAILYSDI